MMKRVMCNDAKKEQTMKKYLERDNSFGADDLRVYICPHVFEETMPVLLVSHEEDGDWQFVCGGLHDEEELPKVVGIGHLLKRDPTLIELAGLQPGYEAERAAVTDQWLITRIGDVN